MESKVFLFFNEIASDCLCSYRNLLKVLSFVRAAYQPLPLIAIRGLVAQQERPQVTWPRLHQSSRDAQAVKKEMLSSWFGGMLSSTSRSLSPLCLGLDVISPLLSIITPPSIRPVSHHHSLSQVVLLTLLDAVRWIRFMYFVN